MECVDTLEVLEKHWRECAVDSWLMAQNCVREGSDGKPIVGQVLIVLAEKFAKCLGRRVLAESGRQMLTFLVNGFSEEFVMQGNVQGTSVLWVDKNGGWHEQAFEGGFLLGKIYRFTPEEIAQLKKTRGFIPNQKAN